MGAGPEVRRLWGLEDAARALPPGAARDAVLEEARRARRALGRYEEIDLGGGEDDAA